MKWSVAALLGLGIVAAFCAAALMTILPGSRINADDGASGRTRQITVLVAARDLPAMAVVAADAVAPKMVTADQAPQGHLGDAVQVVGKVLMVPMVEGQPFSRTCFATEGAGLNLATALPRGKRAVSVALHHYAGLEGLLYPGAQVDVLASFKVPTSANANGKAISTTLLQGVQVLAVHNQTITSPDNEDRSDGSKQGVLSRPGAEALVTLLVDSRQAEALQLAMEHGTVTLALRNPLDDVRVDLDATLLSEGRLAQLASILPASVRAAESPIASGIASPSAHTDRGSSLDTADREELRRYRENTSAESTAPVAPAAPAQWDVLILRGDKSEVRSFPMPDKHLLAPSSADPSLEGGGS